MEYDKGKDRRINPEYNRLKARIYRLRKKYDIAKEYGRLDELTTIRDKIQFYDRRRKQLPTRDQYDPGFRRLLYCRYADDFLIGVIGTKDEGLQVMEKVRDFVHNELNLHIAKDKSGIRHATRKTRFLGYDINAYAGTRVVKTMNNGRHTTSRTLSCSIRLGIPKDKLLKFCHKNGYGDYSQYRINHRPDLLNLRNADIVKVFNAELRGFANYYLLADGARFAMNKLYGLWMGSLLKTLANKHKKTVRKIAKKMKQASNGYVWVEKRNGKLYSVRVFRFRDLPSSLKYWNSVDIKHDSKRYRAICSELARRLHEQICEYCGQKKGTVEVHHVGKLDNIKDGNEPWQEMMKKMHRKTLILCVHCHRLLHAGNLPSWRVYR